MANRVNLPSKRIGETLILGSGGNMSPFNFLSQMGPSDTINSATVTATVYSGNDPAPQSIIGTVTAQTQQVLVTLVGGVLGTIYDVLCQAVTQSGQTLELEGYLAIIPGLP